MALIVMPFIIEFLRRIALKTGLVDVPNSRKIHSKPIPLVGGLSLFCLSVLALLLTKNVSFFSFYLITASGLIVVVGLLDDKFDLSARWRFTVQIAASLLVIYFANIKLDTFGHLILPNWDMQLAWLAIPVTVFGVVGIINAINMSDGVDGLAAMTFFSPVLVLVILSGFDSMSLWLLTVLLGVLIFVAFNMSQSHKVFLGDNGSMFLGFLLGWLLVYYSQGESATIMPVTALYLVAIPVYDTIFVMLRRIFAGLSPFRPDKTHLHHLFLAGGLSQSKTLLAMCASQLVMIGLGVLMFNIGTKEHMQFYLFVILSAIYYFSIKKMWLKIGGE